MNTPDPVAQMRALVDASGQIEYRVIELPMAARLGDELSDLMQAAWEETRMPWLPARCSPDQGVLQVVEQMGGLITLALYSADDRLVGFALAHVHRDVFSEIVMCDGLALHVVDQHRSGNLIRHLLEVLALAAKTRGATLMQWCAPVGTALDQHLSASSCTRQGRAFYAAEI